MHITCRGLGEDEGRPLALVAGHGSWVLARPLNVEFQGHSECCTACLLLCSELSVLREDSATQQKELMRTLAAVQVCVPARGWAAECLPHRFISKVTVLELMLPRLRLLPLNLQLS